MEALQNLLSWFLTLILHMDQQLPLIVRSAGLWSYAILFAVIFIETGVVVMPFLPGDSLLFAAGAVAAQPGAGLDPGLLYLLLALAAVAGDTANYWIGAQLGPRVFQQDSRWFKRRHLERARAFYAKHGGKTIFLARFVPIVRTFAPFVAGIGQMRYPYFLSYNVFGALVWTGLFLWAGYFFGALPIIRDHFSLVIVAIVFLSLLPALVEYMHEKRRPAGGAIPPTGTTP